MPLSPAERERRRKAKAELAASTKAYQAAARPVVKKVKVKKRPLPVPSMEAGLYVPTIEKEPKTKVRPPVTFGRTRRRRAIPHKYEYVPPEDFYLPPAEGGPRAAAIDRYNQRRLRSERTQRRLEKSRARGLMRVLKRDGIEHLDRHLGKNQSADDFIKHGKRDKPGIGDYLKAGAAGLGHSAFDWMMEGSQAKRTSGLKRALQGDRRARGLERGAQAIFELQTDPSTGSFLTGSNDYSPLWAAVGGGFGIAGMGTPAHIEAALGKQALSHADEFARIAGSLRGRMVWSPQRGEWIETAEPVARSRFGRQVERLTEQGRKRGTHRALPWMASGDEKIVEESMRSIGQNSTVLRSWRGKKIMREGRKLRFNKPQHYALRVIANGRSPEDRAAYHLRLAEQAAKHGEPQAALNHATHAEYFREAARYVEQHADGTWHVRQDAPPVLRKIESLWGDSQRMREDTYLQLGLLDEDQIFRRLHMPSWEIDRELSGLRQSEGRMRAEAGLRKMFPDDPQAAESHLAVLDARALAAKQQFLNRVDDDIKALNFKIETEGSSPELEKALGAARLAKRHPEIHPDWYEALGSIQMGIDDQTREAYKAARGGRDFDFATSGMSKEEFYAQPWAQRMPILVDTTLAQDPIAVRMGDHIKVGTPGDSHEDLLDHGSDLPPWAQFRNTQQYAVRIDTQGNVINDEYLPVEYYEAAQRRLDAFNEKRWPTEDNFDFARFAEGDQAWDGEITDEVFSRGLPLPPELAGKGDFENAVNYVFDLAARSADKKDWYKRAARGAVQIAERHPGGTFLPDGVTPDQAAQIIAIMSQAADTVANVTLARVAIDQYAHFGEVFAGRFPSRQGPEVEAVLRGIPWEGRKRSSFYNNIIEDVIGPEEYAARVASGDLVHKPVTVDRWVVRMFRPDSGKDTPDGYYDTFEQALQLMASKLGWDPKEVQAAAWVSIKADELAKELAQKGRGNVRHLAGAGDAYEYGILKNFPEESQGALFDVPPTHPRALRVRNDARKPDGGGSYDVDLNPVTTEGYSASYGAFEVRVPANKFAGHHVEGYRDAHKALLRRQKTSNLGVWHNPEDGVVYLDVSKNFKTKAAAVRFAREQGQLSYWDSKLGASVPTGLEIDEANAIKRALKGEAATQPKIPEPLAKASLDQESPKAVRDWEALLDQTARRLGWVGKNGKPRALDLEGAEDYLWNIVTTAGDTPLANGVRRMAHEADQARRAAADAAMDFARVEEPLYGLPTEVTIKGQGRVKVGPDPELRRAAEDYMAWANLPYSPPSVYRKVVPLEAEEFARAYDEMLDWNDPRASEAYKESVAKAYKAFGDETKAQYDYLVRQGYEFEFMPKGKDPYDGSPRLAIQDLTRNKHMYVFPTDEGFGMGDAAEHPLLADVPGLVWKQDGIDKPVTYNDLFRGVHDAFGHGKEGVGFRWDGEDNAFLSHSSMYSSEARKAMAAETRGQNSWVNFGPHGEANRTASQEDTVYAPQKAGLLPDWIVKHGTGEDLAAVTPAPEGPEVKMITHGMHWVRPDGKGSIHLNPESDSPQAVLAHELAHFDQVTNELPPEAVEVLRGVGMYPPEGVPLGSSAARDYKERFAWAKVQWLHDITGRGDEVDLPESVQHVFAGLSERLQKELEKSRLLDHPDAPGPLSKELTDLFDDLHSWEEILGARFYLADKRGLATNWRRPMRQLNQYMREARVAMAPGRKSAVTVAGRDISTTTKYRALLMRSGYFKGNATDAIGESGIKAARMAALAEAHTELQKVATKTPQSMDDVPMRVDPDIFEPGAAKRYRAEGQQVRKALDLMADMESGRRKVSYKELNHVSMPEIQSIMETYFPEHLDADRTMTEVMADLINRQGEIENVVWINREALESSGLFSNPGTVSLQRLAWSAEQAGVGVDLVNNYVKLTMLQLNPAYYFMNFAGNTTMNLMQQGAYYVPNMILASKLSAEIGEDYATMIDELVGAGVNSIAEMTIRGEGGNALPNILNNLATAIVDRIPRRAAWLHEARRVGIKDPEKIRALLQAADQGDKAAKRVTDHITRRAKDAIVDYDRLSPFEKKYVQRVIFFYPWIKGATRWSLRYPLEHPLQATAFAALFAYQQWSAQEELGNRPWYADLMIPLSIPGIGGLKDEEGNLYVLNPKQLLTMTTPYELARSVAGMAGVAGGEPFVESLTPVLGATVTSLAGRRSFDDQEVPQDVGTFLSELDPRQLPLRKKIEGLINPPEDDSNFLYPRSTLDRWTALFMGSLAPTPYRRSKGEHLAAGKRGITPEIKQSNWAEDYKATYDQEIPAALRRALDAKTEWEKGDQGEKDDEDGLVSAERVLRKFDLLVRHHPEFGQARANIEADVEDPESRRLIDAWIEKALGWNDLDYVRTKVNEAKRGTGTPTINMSRLAALPPSKAWDGSPVVHNADGSTSSVRSMSFNEDGLEVLVPTVWDGAIHSDAEAIARYRRTGEHFGKYRSVSAANAAAKRLHQLEEERGRG